MSTLRPAYDGIILLLNKNVTLSELFNVYLLQSPNLSIYGECLLQVTEENIYVLDNSNTAKRLVTWPLNALRRYGSDANKFTFESGR